MQRTWGRTCAWHFGRIGRRPVWLEQTERREEREGREEERAGRGRGKSCRTLRAAGRT